MMNTFREPILKPDIIVGEICGYTVRIRYAPAPISSDIIIKEYAENQEHLPPNKRLLGSFKTKKNGPALYIVSWGPKRLDSFLNLKNAKNYAKRFICQMTSNV